MKKISMVIVAISAIISLSGCHEDPTYVDSYFQRQSVIEELSNELKGQYSSIFIPVIYNASQEQLDYKSLWKGEVTENGQPIIHYTFGGYENRTVTLQQVPISWISFVIKILNWQKQSSCCPIMIFRYLILLQAQTKKQEKRAKWGKSYIAIVKYL